MGSASGCTLTQANAGFSALAVRLYTAVREGSKSHRAALRWGIGITATVALGYRVWPWFIGGLVDCASRLSEVPLPCRSLAFFHRQAQPEMFSGSRSLPSLFVVAATVCVLWAGDSSFPESGLSWFRVATGRSRCDGLRCLYPRDCCRLLPQGGFLRCE
jgi:hypothetical protein